MDGAVTAAIITGSVTIIGFVVQGTLINRWIDSKRREDTRDLEQIKGKIVLDNSKMIEEFKTQQTIVAQERLREIELQFEKRKKSEDSRRESLEILFNATSMARSAAHDLLNDSVNQSSQERIRKTADSLQKMSQFFEKASESERNLHLISEDVLEVKSVQAGLVKMFLLLDLDSDTAEYRERLKQAYEQFEGRFEQFKTYVRSGTAEG